MSFREDAFFAIISLLSALMEVQNLFLRKFLSGEYHENKLLKNLNRFTVGRIEKYRCRIISLHDGACDDL